MIIVVKSADGSGVRTIDTSTEPAVVVMTANEISEVIGMPVKGHDTLSSGPDDLMQSPPDSDFHKWLDGARSVAIAALRMSAIVSEAKKSPVKPPPQQFPKVFSGLGRPEASDMKQVQEESADIKPAAAPLPMRPVNNLPEIPVEHSVIPKSAPTPDVKKELVVSPPKQKYKNQLTDEEIVKLM